MRIFDTKVQEIKYKVLCQVSKQTWKGNDSFAAFNDIAKVVVTKEDITRCCIYKERAIVAERIKIALGGNAEDPNVVEVIDIACDECPEAGYVVTDLCRGCLAHRCKDACRLGAIQFDEHNKARIDKNKCVECGKCAKVCPYRAINNFVRPCEQSCKVHAIHMGQTGAAEIDPEKCIDCGACVYTCPFGAVVDKSYIVNAINLIQESRKQDFEVYAIMAPAVASQFTYASFGQVITAMKKIGFDHVMETALGADMTAEAEARELLEKGFLTSSCCPAFVKYAGNKFPAMAEKVSHTPSPMAMLGKAIKDRDPAAKVIFIGPCTAKKAEWKLPEVSPYIDCVLTFEELQALIDSMDIDIENLEESVLDEASGFGRGFACSGGVSEAVRQAMKELAEKEGPDSDAAAFELNAAVCDGIESCRNALARANKGLLKENFIEGMACEGGCIGGAGCLTHGEKNRAAIEKYSREAERKTILDRNPDRQR
ncbi:MAG: monomeric [FeFe] hydrogenase [Firmicutes bacterium]|nr:monomeric [FeFe] hydrogenase [Bacillota bacterium]MDY5855901.1 monomeric [FeFe] hydrogenase [Anaerovoracaceae bacterium]